LLRSFLAVAQCGKISTAAKQLHLSQPAVTAHLRRLEEIVGKPLVSRSTRGVKLTSQGHTLHTLANEIQNTLSRIEASFHRDQRLAGELRFGASLTIASDVIPAFVAEFCRAHPAISVELRVDNTETVLESVREGSYPFGFVEGSPRAAGLRLEQFVEDEVILVAGTNPAFRNYQRSVASLKSVRDLYQVPLIWRESGSGTRAVVEAALRKAGIQLKRLTYQYVIADIQAIKTATIHCLGLAFLSRWSVKNDLSLGRIRMVELRDLTVRRGFYWVLPSGALGEPSDTFVRFCNDYRSNLAAAR
ncbi:MAG TPA: LysR family transcriptional regulator, partial [Chthoniobacterales bacterium]|nr:LysR family transcriptional regulator [Chthoniobacterales bacterium]